MSLDRVRDEFLARRAATGDGVAFAELARRYEALIAAATRRPPDSQVAVCGVARDRR